MADKELMWALKNGDLDEVKTLLKKVGAWSGKAEFMEKRTEHNLS